MRIGEAAAAAIVLGCAAGVAIPAFTNLLFFPARSASAADVRLVTSIATTARKSLGTEELIDFTVTVRSIGGSAHGVGVESGIEPAATWVAVPGICRPQGERLGCALGDVSGSTDLDLAARVPASTGPSAPPILVMVTTTSSATTESTIASPAAPAAPPPSATARPKGSRSPAAEPSVSPSTSPSGVPPAAPSAAPSAAPHSALRPSAPTSGPAARRPAAVPRPAGSRPATAHPATAGRPGRRTGTSGQPRQPRATPEPPAVPAVPSVPGPHPRVPSAPGPRIPSSTPPAHAAPAAPPPASMPDLPSVAPPPSGEAGDPGDAPAPGAVQPAPSAPSATAPSDLSLVLPDLGDTSSPPPGAELQASRDPSSIDPPQLSIVRADPVAGSRRAWVTVLGVTIVFETAVLWLAACLSLWRRRATLTQAASSGLTTRLKSVRRAVWASLARLPRILDGLRR